MTLRKGEFWTCSQCTLKNTLAQNTCSACKHVRETPIISGQLSNFRPYTEQNNIVAPTNSSHKTSQNNNRQQQLNLTNTTSTILSPSSPGLQPPSNRTSRSPSPRHERYSGAIPKVSYFFIFFLYKTYWKIFQLAILPDFCLIFRRNSCLQYLSTKSIRRLAFVLL